MNTNRFFNAAKQGDELVLSVYDVVGADMFGDGISASSVASALKVDHKSVTVRINSPGGDAFSGVAIYNLLKDNAKPCNVIVDGLAASAASIIAMAGDSITMNEGAVMMIHEAQALCIGQSGDMRKMADTLDKVTGSIADIYVSRTGLPKDEILAMQSAETWMDSDEAVDKGFADAKADGQKVSNSFDLSVFKHTPTDLLNRLAHTKKVDGENLTSDDFLYVGDPERTETWHLPWRFSTEEKTVNHLRDALARFGQTDLPDNRKQDIWEQLVKLCKEHGIDVGSEDRPTNKADYRFTLLQKQYEMNKRK